MVTILLEQIIELLKGFIDSFKDHAAEVAEKLGLISEDTSDINDNTDTIVSLDSAIKDNTDILVANTGAIKNSSQATSTNTAAIASDTTVIRNNINTISVNSGKTAAFTEDVATNTLNIYNKVTTIASDTTQIRHADYNIYARLNTMYTQLDWLLYGVDFINTISGASPVVFNTDKPFIPIKNIISNIGIIQTGSGIPSPDNIRPITGITSANIGVNNNMFNIPFGQTVYSGSLNVTTGKLISNADYFTVGSNYFSNIATTSGVIRAFTTPNFVNRSLLACDCLNINGNVTTVNSIGITSDYRIYVTPDWAQNVSNIDEFKALLANNPINTILSKATPIEASLTPISIEQISGDNIITTNTNGDLTISYIESVKNHINS